MHVSITIIKPIKAVVANQALTTSIMGCFHIFKVEEIFLTLLEVLIAFLNTQPLSTLMKEAQAITVPHRQ